jgi:integral membrane protein
MLLGSSSGSRGPARYREGAARCSATAPLSPCILSSLLFPSLSVFVRPVREPVIVTTPHRLFRTVAIAETVTWTLLILAMVLKYGVRVGDWPVSIAGLLHGVVFLAFGMTALLVGLNQRWSLLRIVGTAAAAVVPYATIPVERRLARRGALRGVWRTAGSAGAGVAGDVGAAGGALDAGLRWVLARPRTLAVLFLAVLAAITSVLLVVGPPGGRA